MKVCECVYLCYKNQSVNAVSGNNRYFSQIHTKCTNTLCGKNLEFFNVNLAEHVLNTKL